jgi:hypothetical protein
MVPFWPVPMNESPWMQRASCCWLLLGLVGCGSRTGLDLFDPPDTMAAQAQPEPSAVPSATPATVPNQSLCPASQYVDTGCRSEVIEGAVGLCNDLDDDCDGEVDEGCPCTPGSVKACFAGPPLRRGVGACRDGLQSCETTADQTGHYGPCLGGIWPQTEVCDTLDNDCNGCRDEIAGCVPVGSCPGPGDPRIPVLHPFDIYQLRASDYFDGDARSYTWAIEGGPCDRIAPTGKMSFDLTGASSNSATFVPRLSGDYTVSLTITALSGESFDCDWVIPVRGPGLRIEMCYPESALQDLDLYLKRLSTRTPWYLNNTAFSPNPDQCDWHNCEAVLRGSETLLTQTIARADWGYAKSPLSECSGGPLGPQWALLGYCANPRLDIDNNLSQAAGLPENINLDQPGDGDGFRIMVQNFTGTTAHPIVNVYCGGRRFATFGAPPDALPKFTGSAKGGTVGAMWRVADVTTHVTASGDVSCSVTPLHPTGSSTGYFVTRDDASF